MYLKIIHFTLANKAHPYMDKCPSLIYVLSHEKLNTLNNKISAIYLTKLTHFLIQ